MANVPSNAVNHLSPLPLEVLYLILEHLFSGTRLQVSRHPDQLEPTVSLQRSPPDLTSPHLDQYQPHPLRFVSRHLGRVVATFTQRFVFVVLPSTASPQIRHLTPAIFGRIYRLSLTMDQAAHLLYVTVPALPWNHQGGPPLDTPLRLISAPSIQQLEIHWAIVFAASYLDPQIPAQTPIQAAIIRLQYFRRQFELRIILAINHRDGYQMAAGSLVDRVVTIEWLPRPDPWQFMEDLAENRIRYFTRTNSRGMQLAGDSRLRSIVIQAHLDYDFVPLGWVHGPTTAHFPMERSTPRPTIRYRSNEEESSENDEESSENDEEE